MPLTESTVAAIDQRLKDDPDFAAAVDAELQAMRIEQELVALRKASGLSRDDSSPRNSTSSRR
jgi:hypothetical protein